MRKLTYRMQNGTVVNTLAEARKLGQPFTAKMETIPETTRKHPSKRQALLDTVGVVIPRKKGDN